LHRLRASIAGMTAALGGLDALVFTGGVGEHSSQVRALACAGLEFLGLRLAEELNREFGQAVSFTLPAGGLALWLRLDHAVSAEGWAERAAAVGLMVMPGVDFALDSARASEAFRIGYASLDEATLRRAVGLLAHTRIPALEQCCTSGRS